MPSLVLESSHSYSIHKNILSIKIFNPTIDLLDDTLEITRVLWFGLILLYLNYRVLIDLYPFGVLEVTNSNDLGGFTNNNLCSKRKKKRTVQRDHYSFFTSSHNSQKRPCHDHSILLPVPTILLSSSLKTLQDSLKHLTNFLKIASFWQGAHLK